MNDDSAALLSGTPKLTALHALAPVPRVVTIGTFDGVHLGHQHLLRQAAARGQELGMATAAVTFEPLPAQVLRPDRFPGRVCTVAEKYEQLARAPIDQVVPITFTRALAGLSPEAFMAELAGATQLRELWVGDDFALGRQRAGDVTRLREIGQQHGYTVVALRRIRLGPWEVSSSAIRDAVTGGDVDLARQLLGRPFRVGGEVIHGAHLGRAIGFPTANVVPPAGLVPIADGISAPLAWLPGETAPRPAMTYVGTRPTVNTGGRLVETNLLDFEGDLYGLELQVDLLTRLRGDAVFAGLDALVAQLRHDDLATRRVLRDAGINVAPAPLGRGITATP